jgi:hypothetical protein
MQRYQLRKQTSFLKQVAGYVILVFLALEGWGFLSEEANAFVSNVEQVVTSTTALKVQLQAPAHNQNPSSDDKKTSSTDGNVIVTAPDQNANPQPQTNMACPSTLAKTCDEMKMMFPE